MDFNALHVFETVPRCSGFWLIVIPCRKWLMAENVSGINLTPGLSTRLGSRFLVDCTRLKRKNRRILSHNLCRYIFRYGVFFIRTCSWQIILQVRIIRDDKMRWDLLIIIWKLCLMTIEKTLVAICSVIRIQNWIFLKRAYSHQNLRSTAYDSFAMDYGWISIENLPYLIS